MARDRALISTHSIEAFVRALDLLGTFAFAISGAMMGVRFGFDIFGVLVLAFATAVTGGISRDLLIGAVPPAALQDWRYLAVSLLAGFLTFRFHPVAKRLDHPISIFDAVGLSVFAVVGTSKALAFGLSWPMAALLGMLSGIGGGMLRDILSGQVPIVLRSDIYAVAALAGGLVVALGSLVHAPQTLFIVAGAVLCFVLRLLGIWRRWNLPSAR